MTTINLPLFKAFIHTTSIKIHKLDYTPSLITAWMRVIAAIYSIIKLNRPHLIIPTDYLIRFALFIISFMILASQTYKLVGLNIKELEANNLNATIKYIKKKSIFMSENNSKFPDYVTFGRTFENYKWYKPLLTIIVSIILFLVFQTILIVVFSSIYGFDTISGMVRGGYNTLNTSDASVYFSYLSIAIFLPSLYLASRIVHDRPFSSYSSSRGGWNWKLYFKCLIIPIIVYIIVTAIAIVLGIEKGGGKTQVSAITLILCLILIPVQCIAEEYIFRGFVMQTLGSWFKMPIIALIIQTVAFAILHLYNSSGIVGVAVTGFILGFLAWRTNGLEAGAALHSINNLTGFYLVILGLGSISSNVTLGILAENITATLISALLIYYLGNKKGWFDQKTN